MMLTQEALDLANTDIESETKRAQVVLALLEIAANHAGSLPHTNVGENLWAGVIPDAVEQFVEAGYLHQSDLEDEEV